MIDRLRRILVFLSLVLPAASFADCNQALIAQSQFRLSAIDVDVEGDDVWVATSHGVQLYDGSTSPPRPVASLALPGETSKVRANGSFAYVASDSTLYVVRRGSSLTQVGKIDLGSRVHGLLVYAPQLYAATSSGVVQLDLGIPDRPVITNRLPTSSGFAFSLARLESFLYVADGDNDVDVFSIQIPSFPQRAGGLASLPRAVSVRVGGSRLYVSDGQQTEVWSGRGLDISRIGVIGFGIVSLFPLIGDISFTAGNDRVLRVIDASLPNQSLVLFETELNPAGGTIHRVFGISGRPGTIFVAAGDAGLLSFDVTRFVAPFPTQAHSIGGVTSVVFAGDGVVTSGAGEGLFHYSVTSGRLSLVKSWETSKSWQAHDASGSRVLTSSLNSLALWDIAGASAVKLSSVTLPSSIHRAILLQSSALALTASGDLYRVDLSQTAGVATKLSNIGAPYTLSRSSLAVVTGQLNEDGTTTLRYYENGDLAQEPRTVTIEGAATSGIALHDSGLGAAVTFRGLTRIDFRTGAVTVIPGTSSSIVKSLATSLGKTLLLTAANVEVWDLSSSTKEASFPVSASSTRVSGHPSLPLAAVASPDGVTTIQYESESELPRRQSSPSTNRYFDKIASDGALLALLDDKTIDVFAIYSDSIPRLVGQIRVDGAVVDMTVADRKIYALLSVGKVVAYDAAGSALYEQTLGSGSVIPRSIHAVGSAIYASLSRGCPTACEELTFVLDGRNRLAQTSLLTGILVDIDTDGTRAFALFDVPAQIRILDVADPAHPSTLLTRSSEPLGIDLAHDASTKTLYLAAGNVIAFDDANLEKRGEIALPAATIDAKLRLEIEGGCALLTGRTPKPLLYSIRSRDLWEPLPTPPTASIARDFVWNGAAIDLLTSHSLDVWSSQPRPSRARPSGRH